MTEIKGIQLTAPEGFVLVGKDIFRKTRELAFVYLIPKSEWEASELRETDREYAYPNWDEAE